MVPIPIDGKLQTCVFLDTPGHEVSSGGISFSNFLVSLPEMCSSVVVNLSPSYDGFTY